MPTSRRLTQKEELIISLYGIIYDESLKVIQQLHCLLFRAVTDKKVSVLAAGLVVEVLVVVLVVRLLVGVLVAIVVVPTSICSVNSSKANN